jgi:hypothetical protein
MAGITSPPRSSAVTASPAAKFGYPRFLELVRALVCTLQRGESVGFLAQPVAERDVRKALLVSPAVHDCEARQSRALREWNGQLALAHQVCAQREDASRDAQSLLGRAQDILRQRSVGGDLAVRRSAARLRA